MQRKGGSKSKEKGYEGCGDGCRLQKRVNGSFECRRFHSVLGRRMNQNLSSRQDKQKVLIAFIPLISSSILPRASDISSYITCESLSTF